jgi:CopG family transcriptional regulator/antitoxin EndoAI
MAGGQLAEENLGNSFKLNKSKQQLREELKKGYSQMADLNLKLAQEGLVADKEAYQQIQ